MSLSCATGSTIAHESASPSLAYVTLQGNSYSGAEPTWTVYLASRWGATYPPSNAQDDGDNVGASGSWSAVVGPLTADKTYYFQAEANSGESAEALGAVRAKKTGAVVATASTPTSSNVAATTADIACDYLPNVLESTATAQLQYKRTTDPTWTNAGTAGTLGGYVTRSATASLTGLDPNTQYQVRLVITRNVSAGGTSVTSASASFTTISAAPFLTNNQASGVSYDNANLNATVEVPTGGTCRVRFEYGEETGPPFSFTTAWQEFLTAGTFNVQQHVTGLTPSTLYHYDSRVGWPSPGYENEKWSDA